MVFEQETGKCLFWSLWLSVKDPIIYTPINNSCPSLNCKNSSRSRYAQTSSSPEWILRCFHDTSPLAWVSFQLDLPEPPRLGASRGHPNQQRDTPHLYVSSGSTLSPFWMTKLLTLSPRLNSTPYGGRRLYLCHCPQLKAKGEARNRLRSKSPASLLLSAISSPCNKANHSCQHVHSLGLCTHQEICWFKSFKENIGKFVFMKQTSCFFV